MTTRRALVVDDSKSARVAMKRMLKKYALKVDFAESGEEALLFLEHSSADVIFMDHNMPGMDGLEAVAAIKSNPRTATIPVMMYTTNNDDVYVSQARALGALAVLPKEVQPGVLFDSLLKLGLVEDRREEPEKVPFAQLVQGIDEQELLPSEADKAFDQQALSVSIQTQITRTLEEQHLQLRSDILNVKRDFAKRVSREIIDQQRADQSLLDTVEPTETEKDGFAFKRAPLLAWAVTVFLLLTLTGITLSGLSKQDRVSEALDGLTRSVDANTNKIIDLPLATTSPQVQSGNAGQTPSAPAQNTQYIRTLEWALNDNNDHAYTEMAFNQQAVLSLENLLAQLDALGFTGRIQMESHLGEFCLVNDGSAGYKLAPGNSPLSQCDLIGHPKDDSVFINDQQSVEFINFIDSFPILSKGDIGLSIIANNRQSSSRKYPLPTDASNADDWNRAAQLNNRIVYSLIPD